MAIHGVNVPLPCRPHLIENLDVQRCHIGVEQRGVCRCGGQSTATVVPDQVSATDSRSARNNRARQHRACNLHCQ
eukprot:1298448-Rhodomonas_salina.3